MYECVYMRARMSCMVVLTGASMPLAMRRGSARARAGAATPGGTDASGDGDCGHRPDEAQRASLPTLAPTPTRDTGDRRDAQGVDSSTNDSARSDHRDEDERHPRVTPCPAQGHPEAVPPIGPGPPGTPKRPTSANAVVRGWGGSATLAVGP